MMTNKEQSASIHFSRSIGVDVHKNLFVCCAVAMQDNKPQVVEERRFGGFYQDLEEATDWCISHNPEIITMESTGIYWEFFAYRLLDRGLLVNVVNPTHVKGLRGKRLTKRMLHGLQTSVFSVQQIVRLSPARNLESFVFSCVIALVWSENCRAKRTAFTSSSTVNASSCPLPFPICQARMPRKPYKACLTV